MSSATGKLAGRRAIVTGAAGGIGQEIVRVLARNGAAVAVADLDGNGAERLAAQLREGGAEAVATAFDVGEPESVARAFAALRTGFGEPDILVNNAGIDTTSDFVDMPLAMWDEMIRVNLRSLFLVTREALPAMRRRRWGRIINIASQLAFKGGPQMVHYAAAKAGVVGFTRSLALEVAQDGVTVNGIAPGPIDTPMLRSLPEAWVRRKLAELPIGRAGRVEEIAPAVLLLASDEGANFIGTTLHINGGDFMG